MNNSFVEQAIISEGPRNGPHWGKIGIQQKIGPT